MNHVPVKSTAIASVAYDEEAQVLELAYLNGERWRYAGVKPDQHAELMAAASIGRYAHQYIRPLGGTKHEEDDDA